MASSQRRSERPLRRAAAEAAQIAAAALRADDDDEEDDEGQGEQGSGGDTAGVEVGEEEVQTSRQSSVAPSVGSTGTSDWIGSPPREPQQPGGSKRRSQNARGRGKGVLASGSTRAGGRKARRVDQDDDSDVFMPDDQSSSADEDLLPTSTSLESGQEPEDSMTEETDGDVTARSVASLATRRPRKSEDPRVALKNVTRRRMGRPPQGSSHVADISLVYAQRCRAATSVRIIRNDYTHRDQKPVFLPGPLQGGIRSISEPVRSLADVGVSPVSTKMMTTRAEQAELVMRHTNAWNRVQHHTLVGQLPHEDLSALVADWRWQPGKASSAPETGRSNTEVLGAGLIPSFAAPEVRILKASERTRYQPQPVSAEPDGPASSNTTVEEIENVVDLVDRPALADNADGDYTLAVGPIPPNPDDAMASVLLPAKTAERLTAFGIASSSIVYNAGSYVYSVDWAPAEPQTVPHTEYLAVATSVSSLPGNVPMAALGQESDRPGNIDVVSLQGDYCRLEYRIGVPQGEVLEARWLPCGWEPLGGNTPSRIGILACRLSNRKIVIYTVPRPESIQPGLAKASPAAPTPYSHGLIVELEALLTFDFFGPSRQPTTMTWGGGEYLAVGCVDGSVTIWAVGELLREQARERRRPTRDTSTASNGRTRAPHARKPLAPLPCHNFAVCDSCVTTLVFLDLPPRSTTGRDPELYTSEDVAAEGYDVDAPPHLLLVSCLSGVQRVVDLYAGGGGGLDGSAEIARLREPCYATCFLPFLGLVVGERGGDNCVRIIHIRPELLGRTSTLGQHQGRCTALSASPFHPLIASGGAEGSVKLHNSLGGVPKGIDKTAWNLHRLDIHRTSGRLRLVDHFVGLDVSREELLRAEAVERNVEAATKEQADALGVRQTFAWHPVVKVTDVKWCPNAQGAFLLASATAAGLVRLDWVAPGLRRQQPKTEQ